MAPPNDMATTEVSQPHCGFPADAGRIIYWHRDLPPVGADAICEHILEANSTRVPGTLAHRDELWNQCYRDLMAQARLRFQQEVARLGGNYAHVLNESVGSQHDEITGENWLHGRFSYMLYRQPKKKPN